MKLRKLIQCAIAGMALSITGAAAETPKDTLVVADAIDDVITLDPGEVSEIGGVLTTNQVYQQLVGFDPADPAMIVGILAKSWTVAEDGVTFTFTMDRSARFASGNPVTAHDAEYSLRRIVKMKSRSAFILSLIHISEPTRPY